MTSSITTFHGPYNFTVFGGGIAVLLRKGDHIIHWQGDEAEEISSRWGDEGPAILDAIWDTYADVAQHDPA